MRRYLLVLFFITIEVSAKAGMKDSVYAVILAAEIKHPEIVLKQAILETGWFQSKFLMRKNNLFGFRATKYYMSFESWRACVDYYKRWQDKFYTNPQENYYVFLKRIKYSHSKEYVPTLMRIDLRRSTGAKLPIPVPQPAPQKTEKPPR